MSVQSIYFCEPLKVGHLPYLFPGPNVAKIIRCISLQSWSFFLSHCKFYSAFSRKRFSWPGLFRTWFIFSDWFLRVSFSRFQYSNLHFGSLLHSFINCLGYWALFAKDFCPCLLLFICKGLLSIFVLSCSYGFCYMFTKDAVFVHLFIYKGRCPYSPFCLQRTAVLVFCYSFAKDHSPCVVVFILKGPLSLSSLFICKGPLSLSGAIYLQRTSSLSKATHLQRTPSLSYVIHSQRTRYLFCAVSLQRKLLFLLSICCPGKIRWTATPAKHRETAYRQGL